MNNVYCVLSAAFVLANVCIWSTLAEDGTKRVKYDYEVGEGSVPHIVMARRTPVDDAPIIFVHEYEDRDTKYENDKTKYANQSMSIPLNLVQRINNIENFADLQNLVDNIEIDVGNRFGEEDGDNIDRKGAVTPKPASCAPEPVVVPLHDSEDKSLFFYPSCTRVERCGGCCSHELLSCQPTATELLNFQVIVTEYKGGSKLSYKEKKIVTVEQHTKCKCDCKVKESDCNSLQEYNLPECRCVCLNVDEEEKCSNDNDTKLWDPKQCICGCRETKECSTGFYFNQKTCQCVPVPIIRRRVNDAEIRYRTGETDPKRYVYNPRPVVPLKNLDENNPENS